MCSFKVKTKPSKKKRIVTNIDRIKTKEKKYLKKYLKKGLQQLLKSNEMH